MNIFRGPRSISNGDFPSINFTLESNNSRTSYTLPQTSGTPRSTPNSPYTASIAVRTEYSVVKTVSLGVSANCPKKAKFTHPSGITSGRSPFVRGMKKAVMYGIIVGTHRAEFVANSSI